MNYIISKELSRQVLMSGVKYKGNHPGGISAVVQYWSEYIDGIRYFPMFKEGSRISKIIIFACSYIRMFLTLLFDKRVKIVHVHTAAGTDFKRSTKVINLAKKFGKKVILHSHASQFKVFYAEASNEQQKKILQTLRKADKLIVLSESWKEWFEKIGVESKKIIILHNITAYPKFLSVDKQNQIDIDKRPVRFLFMGEIGQRKGVFDIIRGLSKHKEEIKEKIELRIGGNKMETQLREAIADGGLSDFVKFEGWVSGEKKIELLNWADVYILPSFNEGLPISILEAMSYKKPIISTPVGGIPEVVDKSNGILVTPGNDEEIFSAMKHYVDNVTDIKMHGEESYKKAETYLPDYVLNHLKRIYESLILQ